MTSPSGQGSDVPEATGSAAADPVELELAGVVVALRDRAPLVHCVTAAVSMGIVADALLACGARPMMTETAAEAPILVGRADALLVNLGTLSTDGLAGIPPTLDRARELGVPWVLDPAAVGPTPVRLELALLALAHGPSVVRANASEVLVLAGQGTGGRGADSTDPPERADAAARRVLDLGARAVAVSGAVDVVHASGGVRATVPGGDAMLTRVTGTGCALGALTAACAAVADPLTAAAAASAWFAVAAERAAVVAGPGSFRVELLDALAALAPQDLTGRVLPA